jgi:antitoxin ParD1/3/4
MAESLHTKVRAGQYASESAVIQESLRALLARDRAIDNRLHHQVGQAFDGLQSDPSRALTVDQVRRRLAEEQKRHGA